MKTITTTERTPTDRRYFADAEAGFVEAADALDRALSDEHDARAEIADLQRQVRALEAQWWAEGLTLGGQPCHNEREREAALAQRRALPPHRLLEHKLREAERRLSQSQRDAEYARSLRTLALQRMRYATALLLGWAESSGE